MAPANNDELRCKVDFEKRVAEMDSASMFAVVYEIKFDGVQMPEDSKFFGISYFGQTVRAKYSSPEQALQKRFAEHVRDASNHPKEIGLRYFLKTFGVNACTQRIVDYKYAPEAAGRAFANELEKKMIAANGGKLRDMNPCSAIMQTLNLTDGGQGNALDRFKTLSALHLQHWHQFISNLKAFASEHGHVKVPLNTHLGRTVRNVRNDNTFLTYCEDVKERRRLLESLPGWSWNVKEEMWNNFKNELEQFVAEHGHCQPPVDHPLHNRLHCYRYRYKNSIHAERRAFLSSQPGWYWSFHDDRWECFVAKLQDFVADHGHAEVPCRTELGKVVHSVRNGQMISGHKDERTRKAFLESLPGWVWSVPDRNFDIFYNEMLCFVKEHGHALVPQNCKLGKKLNKARNGRFRAHQPQNKLKLEALPGWKWNARK